MSNVHYRLARDIVLEIRGLPKNQAGSDGDLRRSEPFTVNVGSAQLAITSTSLADNDEFVRLGL
jgi:hypothetical protein